MKKLSTLQRRGTRIFKDHTLMIGLDLDDRSSYYCILDQEGKVIQEGLVATSNKAIGKVFGSIVRCRIGMEVGTHSPWVSRLLHAWGHEVVVANPGK